MSNPQNSYGLKRRISLWLRKNPFIDWLLDTRKRNDCSMLSSFYLFFKYGRHELDAGSINRNSKYIEFIGLSGSGKTTLYHLANGYLKNHLGYFPGPSRTWMEILKDDRITTGKNNSLRLLDKFIVNNKTFFSWVIKQYSIFENGWRQLKNIDFSQSYFLAVCTFYQTRFRENYSVWTMLDEGFYDNLFKFASDSSYVIQPALVNELVSSTPKVNLLFYIKTDIETCVKRLNMRKKGIPGPYRGLNSKEFLNYLKMQDELTAGFVKNIPSESTKIVEIDNNQSLEESFALIMLALDALLEESKG